MLFTLPLFELSSIFDHLTAESPRGLESAIVSTGPGGSFAISNGTINWRSRVITTVSFSVVWLFDKRFFIFFCFFIFDKRNFIFTEFHPGNALFFHWDYVTDNNVIHNNFLFFLVFSFLFSFFFFYPSLLSRTFTIHRTAGEGERYYFNLTFSTISTRHQPDT